MPSQPWTINIDGSREIVLEIVDPPGIELEEHGLGALNLKRLEPIEGIDVLEIDGDTE